MKFLCLIFPFLLFGLSCHSQKEPPTNKLIGGPCEGCEAVLEHGNQALTYIDTLPDFDLFEPKINISGIIYQKDAKTPAAGVILYIYHTNREGIYERKADAKGWGRSHGYIRTWIKTNEKGQYSFYSFRPASYPNRTEPEHIHLTVKEPDKNEYYIDVIEFEDDPLLTQEKRQRREQRGGSGIIKLRKEGDIWTGRRDIYLGKNIPNYP